MFLTLYPSLSIFWYVNLSAHSTWRSKEAIGIHPLSYPNIFSFTHNSTITPLQSLSLASLLPYSFEKYRLRVLIQGDRRKVIIIQVGSLSFKKHHSTFKQWVLGPLPSFVFHLTDQGIFHHPYYFLGKFDNSIFLIKNHY